MTTIRNIFLCAFLAACTALAVYCVAFVRSATLAAEALPSTVAREFGATRQAMLEELRATRTALVGDAASDCARAQCPTPPLPLASQALQLADAQLTQAREMADRRAGDALGKLDGIAGKADAQLATLNATARDLATQADATLVGLGQAEAAASQLLATGDRTVHDLHPQLLGLVAAAKVTAGETAQTMRTFQGAVPSFIAQGNSIAANVNVATAQFSGVATNLNKITKPKWYDRLIGYTLSFGSAYRDLNPGYNAGQAIRGMFTKTQ